MNITVIDNYDSFVYNLCDYFGRLEARIKVYRNDEKTPDEIISEMPDAVVISPGPGSPADSGISVDLITSLPPGIPLLGVCLGHQALAAAFGGNIVGASRILHGKTSPVYHNARGVFKGIKAPFLAARYHSLIVERETLPGVFEITAETDTGEIMAMNHRELPLFGVQFHPESIITECGMDIIQNFLNIAAGISDVS